MNKQSEETPEKKGTEWLSGLLGVWMFTCIAVAVIGFFVSSTPWANLFYCAAAMFAGGGIVGLFSPKQDEKDGGASGLILGAIILFITALVNGNWLWGGVAVIVAIYAIKKLNTKDGEDTETCGAAAISTLQLLPDGGVPITVRQDRATAICSGRMPMGECCLRSGFTMSATASKTTNISPCSGNLLRTIRCCRYPIPS